MVDAVNTRMITTKEASHPSAAMKRRHSSILTVAKIDGESSSNEMRMPTQIDTTPSRASRILP